MSPSLTIICCTALLLAAATADARAQTMMPAAGDEQLDRQLEVFMSRPTECAPLREIDRLLSRSGGDEQEQNAELMRHIARYVASEPVFNVAGGIPTTGPLRRVWEHRNISGADAVYALESYLGTDDKRLLGATLLILREAGGLSVDQQYGREPVFDALRGLFISPPATIPLADPPAPLVHAMYSNHPQAALNTMSATYGGEVGHREQARVDEDARAVTIHVLKSGIGVSAAPVAVGVEDAVARLAGSAQWWVRLYAASVMRHHSELRQEDLIERLAVDGNSLVQVYAERELASTSARRRAARDELRRRKYRAIIAESQER